MKAAHLVDQVLLAHYLLHDRPVRPTGRWITFRQFPGGQFYWGPFQRRSAEPLAREIGGDVDGLRQRLDRFDWRVENVGDLAARIRVVGPVEVLLVPRAGDEEFDASVDVLFDESLRAIFCAEDAAALAGRVCMALCRQPCRPCSGCGLCDHTPLQPEGLEGSSPGQSEASLRAKRRPGYAATRYISPEGA
jgi:hypothetical protein